jgi:hypothetical protein
MCGFSLFSQVFWKKLLETLEKLLELCDNGIQLKAWGFSPEKFKRTDRGAN